MKQILVVFPISRDYTMAQADELSNVYKIIEGYIIRVLYLDLLQYYKFNESFIKDYIINLEYDTESIVFINTYSFVEYITNKFMHNLRNSINYLFDSERCEEEYKSKINLNTFAIYGKLPFLGGIYSESICPKDSLEYRHLFPIYFSDRIKLNDNSMYGDEVSCIAIRDLLSVTGNRYYNVFDTNYIVELEENRYQDHDTHRLVCANQNIGKAFPISDNLAYIKFDDIPKDVPNFRYLFDYAFLKLVLRNNNRGLYYELILNPNEQSRDCHNLPKPNMLESDIKKLKDMRDEIDRLIEKYDQ